MNDFSFGNEKAFLYTQKNILDLISEAGGQARIDFLYIMDFISNPRNIKPSRGRISLIKNLTHYEKISLKYDFNIEDLDLEKDIEDAYIINRTRCLYVPKLGNNFYINIINDISYVIFGDLIEEDIVIFIYNFVTNYICYNLKKYNIIQYTQTIEDIINRIESNMTDNISTIEEAEFIVEYYASIFNMIYNVTNHDIITWDYIWEKFGPGWILMDEEIYIDIWNYAVAMSEHNSDINREDFDTYKFKYFVVAVEKLYSYAINQ